MGAASRPSRAGVRPEPDGVDEQVQGAVHSRTGVLVAGALDQPQYALVHGARQEPCQGLDLDGRDEHGDSFTKLLHGIRVVERPPLGPPEDGRTGDEQDRKSTRLDSSHVKISYAVFCWK